MVESTARESESPDTPNPGASFHDPIDAPSQIMFPPAHESEPQDSLDVSSYLPHVADPATQDQPAEESHGLAAIPLLGSDRASYPSDEPVEPDPGQIHTTIEIVPQIAASPSQSPGDASMREPAETSGRRVSVTIGALEIHATPSGTAVPAQAAPDPSPSPSQDVGFAGFDQLRTYAAQDW